METKQKMTGKQCKNRKSALRFSPKYKRFFYFKSHLEETKKKKVVMNERRKNKKMPDGIKTP